MQIMHFTPPQIAKHFDVNESTIKRWIQSGKLKSSQTIGGHYRVSEAQMNEFLSKYGRFTESSYVLSRLAKKNSSKTNGFEEYFNFLYNNDSPKAFKIISHLYFEGTDISHIFDKIIIPTLKKVGSEWEVGRLDVSIEHRMSFQIAQHINEIGSYIAESKKKNNKIAILACTPSNSHILPMLIGDVVLKKYEFKREVLGINISILELEKSIIRCGVVSLVCISNTYDSEDNNQYLKEVIRLSKKYGFALVLSGAGWSDDEIKLADSNSVRKILSLYDFGEYVKSL